MNLLEHYIIEVASVEDISGSPRVKEIFGDEKVCRVILVTDCCGRKETSTNIWTESKWNEIRNKGYYMG